MMMKFAKMVRTNRTKPINNISTPNEKVGTTTENIHSENAANNISGQKTFSFFHPINHFKVPHNIKEPTITPTPKKKKIKKKKEKKTKTKDTAVHKPNPNLLLRFHIPCTKQHTTSKHTDLTNFMRFFAPFFQRLFYFENGFSRASKRQV